MGGHVFCGFGFGAIGAGLFAKEARESGSFSRIVFADVDAELVDAVRRNRGTYYVNVAGRNGVNVVGVDAVELLNPGVAADGQVVREALADSTEIATCLPSVTFFAAGGDNSVAALIADGIAHSRPAAKIIYAAENDNRAAEILQEAAAQKGAGPNAAVQFLNTVIGKMSRVVTDPDEISRCRLTPVAPGLKRGFLVEEFNRILVTRTMLPGFRPGIEVFVEKDDLLPFEEAKLYGHNAIHALIGFLGAVKGYETMAQLKDDADIMRIGREAFLNESGAALVAKYGSLGDDLFTEHGYRQYAEDLLERMANPCLADTIARTTRDVVRKLGPNDRIFGTMRLALEYRIEPKNMALGAMAAIALLLANAEEYGLPAALHYRNWQDLTDSQVEAILAWVWRQHRAKPTGELIGYVQAAKRILKHFASR